MAIEVSQNRLVAGDSLLVVKCDQCDNSANRAGKDYGEAADKARDEGFITIPGAKQSSPKSWLCPRCANPSNKCQHK